MCPPKRIKTAIKLPTIDPRKRPPIMFTAIAMPVVARDRARRRAYERSEPIMEGISSNPRAPDFFTTRRRVTTTNANPI